VRAGGGTHIFVLNPTYISLTTNVLEHQNLVCGTLVSSLFVCNLYSGFCQINTLITSCIRIANRKMAYLGNAW